MKSREQVGLKLTGQYDVQTYFFIKKFNEIYTYEVIAYHCIFKGLTKKQIYFLFGRIYFTHT